MQPMNEERQEEGAIGFQVNGLDPRIHFIAL